MEDTFNDRGFNQFVGGVADLDEDIAPLIYHLYKTNIVKTIYGCCSGHIGVQLCESASTRRQTHFTYGQGHLYFMAPEKEGHLEEFLEGLKGETRKVKFAELRKGYCENSYGFHLEMEDLIEPGSNSFFKGDIPIEIAKQRYVEFQNVWNSILKMSEGICPRNY